MNRNNILLLLLCIVFSEAVLWIYCEFGKVSKVNFWEFFGIYRVIDRWKILTDLLLVLACINSTTVAYSFYLNYHKRRLHLCSHFVCIVRYFCSVIVRVWLSYGCTANTAHRHITWHVIVCLSLWCRGVRNLMKMSDTGFLKTRPNRTELKIQKPKTKFVQFSFQKPILEVWRWRFIMLSHLQFIFKHNRIKIFFFMPCLCTSSSESLWLTISWTNSAQST